MSAGDGASVAPDRAPGPALDDDVSAQVREYDDVSDLHSTPFMDAHIVVRNTSTGDDPEDGFRTGGWMWPASFVMLRFLENLFARQSAESSNANRDGGDNESPADDGEGSVDSSVDTAVKDWLRLPRHPPRSFLDFSAGPGLIGIAVARALPPTTCKVHITDFGKAQIDLIRRNCALNNVEASVSELRWGDKAGNLLQPAAQEADQRLPEDAAARRESFDVVVCSDCLFIACRDDLRQEFVDSLLSLVGEETVVLISYTPRRPDEPSILKALAEQGNLQVREVPQELMDFSDLTAEVEEVCICARLS